MPIAVEKIAVALPTDLHAHIQETMTAQTDRPGTPV